MAQIVTFGTMAARGAIRDVGRVLGIPYQTVDEVAKMVPMELKMTLEKALAASKELKARCDNDPQIRELIETAQKIEGMPRPCLHPRGWRCDYSREISDYVPLATNDGNPVTQFPMTTIEELGLLKMMCELFARRNTLETKQAGGAARALLRHDGALNCLFDKSGENPACGANVDAPPLNLPTCLPRLKTGG